MAFEHSKCRKTVAKACVVDNPYSLLSWYLYTLSLLHCMFRCCCYLHLATAFSSLADQQTAAALVAASSLRQNGSTPSTSSTYHMNGQSDDTMDVDGPFAKMKAGSQPPRKRSAGVRADISRSMASHSIPTHRLQQTVVTGPVLAPLSTAPQLAATSASLLSPFTDGSMSVVHDAAAQLRQVHDDMVHDGVLLSTSTAHGADNAARLGRSFRASWGADGRLVTLKSPQSLAGHGATAIVEVLRLQTITIEPETAAAYIPMLSIHNAAAGGYSPRVVPNAAPVTAATALAPIWRLPHVSDTAADKDVDNMQAASNADPNKKADDGMKALLRAVHLYINATEQDGCALPTNSSKWVTMQSWRLLNALWGQEYGKLGERSSNELKLEQREPLLQRRRELAIDNWFREALGSSAAKCVSNVDDGQAGHSEATYARITELLVTHRPHDAAILAVNAGMSRLATVLATAGSKDDTICTQIRQQLDLWSIDTLTKMPPALLLVYTLLSGTGIDTNLSAFTAQATGSASHCLDWLRQIGMCKWFCRGSHAIADATAQYSKCFIADKASKPIALYLGFETADTVMSTYDSDVRTYCLLYHLLMHYSNGSSILRCLDPLSVTPDILDYRHAWHLHSVLEARGLITTADADARLSATITSSFVFQLLNADQWQWALYAALTTASESMRTQIAHEFVLRYGYIVQSVAPISDKTSRLEKATALHLPSAWFAEAAGIQAAYEGRYSDAFEHYVKAELLSEAHDILLQHIAPLYISRGVAHWKILLNSYLKHFQSKSDGIKHWHEGGQVYVECLSIDSWLHEAKRSQAVDVQSIVTKLQNTLLKLPALYNTTAARTSEAEQSIVKGAFSKMEQYIQQKIEELEEQQYISKQSAWPHAAASSLAQCCYKHLRVFDQQYTEMAQTAMCF
jgi:Nuclear protein 96